MTTPTKIAKCPISHDWEKGQDAWTCQRCGFIQCVHHWRIDEPNGKQSRGTCRTCGAERMFHNGCELDRDVGLHHWHDIALSGSRGVRYKRRGAE